MIIPLKVNVQLMWYEDHVALVLNPKEWVSGIWISRFYLATEEDKPSTGGFGPCWDAREEDRPLEVMDVSVSPWRKPKKIAEVLRLRNRKVPPEPTRRKKARG